jgi:hypothetical protein
MYLSTNVVAVSLQGNSYCYSRSSPFVQEIVDMMVRPTDAECELLIFHEQWRKIMALIPLKARAGMGALSS